MSRRVGLATLSNQITLACALMFTVSGCILPPEHVQPRILTSRELELVSLLKDGKDYASGGRLDLAEEKFRKVIALGSKEPSLYNDLGFVLSAEERFDEAIPYFERALEIAPASLVTRDNYARVLYLSGRDEAALEQYRKLLNDYLDTWLADPAGQGVRDFDQRDIVSVFRNIAILSAVTGRLDEAVCNSEFAASLKDASYPPLAHGRFLISLELPGLSAEYLRQKLTDMGADSLDFSVVFDFGVALLLNEQPALAKQAFEQVSAQDQINDDLRTTSRLLRMLIAKRAGDVAGANDIRDLLDESTVCNSGVRWTKEYWPKALQTELEGLLIDVCGEPV